MHITKLAIRIYFTSYCKVCRCTSANLARVSHEAAKVKYWTPVFYNRTLKIWGEKTL